MCYINRTSFTSYIGETHVTDDLTDDIIWIQGTRMPWFDSKLGHLKKEKVYILYMFYISYILYI